ncbi:MAG TPA: calcium/sodium antiporter [Phycisphaerales bacterium]|nr:calcium/sodium antiporter [Phycisphaerales bacterium]
MLTASLLLLLSLCILTFGAEMLVRGSTGAAARLGLSPLFIGLTIVGFGTSTPELATGIVAAIEQHDDINVGNIVGSNICNIAVILGGAAIISPIAITSRSIRSEAVIVLLVAFMPFCAVLTGGITRWLGMLMLLALMAYVWRGFRAGRAAGSETTEGHEVSMSVGRSAMLIVVSIALLAFGSYILVSSATDIARLLGLTELAIALTVVALGTSAPELFTSVIAAIRGRADIALGNVLGSNVFNILGILGMTSIIRPQAVNGQVLAFDGPVMVAMSLTCLILVWRGTCIGRIAGFLLVLSYAIYCAAVMLLSSQ